MAEHNAKHAQVTDQSPGPAMTAPAMNVHLLSSFDSITAIISQAADGAVRCNAAVNDGQMQEVELAL